MSRTTDLSALALIQPGGRLAQHLKGFEARPQQQAMLQGVLQAYQDQAIALIEAGTGIGKSVAYLIPAILRAAKTGERTVISTNTITLQEQLIHKDIPMVLQALGLEVKAELVKGMGNYLCLRKTEEALMESQLFSPDEAEELQRIEAWRGQTHDGSLSDLPFVPSYATRERTAAESDTCTSRSCPQFQHCFFFNARKQAQDAQIIVVNHHLLFSDLAQRAAAQKYDQPAILPPYQHLIIDEAHNIEDIATKYFAARVSHWDAIRITSRLSAERNGRLTTLRTRLFDFLLKHKGAASSCRQVQMLLEIDLPGQRREVVQEFSNLFESLHSFIQLFKTPSEEEEAQLNGEKKLRLLPAILKHPDWTQNILPRVKQAVMVVDKYCIAIQGLLSSMVELKHQQLLDQTAGLRQEIGALSARLRTMTDTLNAIVNGEVRSDRVRWLETFPLRGIHNVTLVDAQLNIAEKLAEGLFSKFQTVVLCSATLTTNRTFSYFRTQLGLESELLKDKAIREHVFDSPFNYREHALLVIPTDVPPPSESTFLQAATERIWESILVSRGNSLVLFTSFQMLNRCHQALEERFHERRFPLLKQGAENRNVLLHKLRTLNHSVLFATYSFWEGVDVAGDALRCVIIVKLPFQVPTEPILQGRAEAIQAAGGNPFLEMAVPLAAVKFKQGCGRLIRKSTDRGCIVCLDSRLVTKAYGVQFLHSIPECGRVVDHSTNAVKRMGEFYRKTQYLVAGGK